jgi:erythromycin esterase
MANILRTIIILLAAISCTNSTSQTEGKEISNWVAGNSQKIETIVLSDYIDDLNFLRKISVNSEIVCLGESRHDIREQFLLKHRFIKYLIQELGFRTFVLEASLPYSHILNDYIINGAGNIDDIMSNMPGWFLWDTEEMKNIFKWLLEYNLEQTQENKVSFYGIDIVAPNYGLEQIFEYLQNVDYEFYKEIQNKNFAQNLIEDNYWPTTLERYSELSEKDKQIISNNYDKLYQIIKQNNEFYIDKSSQKEYDWILMLAYSAKEANNMFSEENRLNGGLIRDNAMANIASWIKERNDKIIIWAHNVHIAKSEFTMNMFPDNPIKGMGYLLNRSYQDKMISIGASFKQGLFHEDNRTFKPALENTIDGELSKLNMDYFLLDLNGEPKDKIVDAWLNEINQMRGQEFEMYCKPIQSFDALFFTGTISKVTYNPRTRERMRN